MPELFSTHTAEIIIVIIIITIITIIIYAILEHILLVRTSKAGPFPPRIVVTTNRSKALVLLLFVLFPAWLLLAAGLFSCIVLFVVLWLYLADPSGIIYTLSGKR